MREIIKCPKCGGSKIYELTYESYCDPFIHEINPAECYEPEPEDEYGQAVPQWSCGDCKFAWIPEK